jgi:alanyl-tRNA synthetase
VGFTARHHTFFEMLGNFSFGDYFKGEAIAWAHEFLIREAGLDPARLAYTVFAGEEGIPADDEARTLWKKVAGVGDDRVLGLGAKDNFWSMGETGPCGPCSEIHFHVGDHVPCPEPTCQGVACDCDRWIEIWNLVFMQFERHADGRRSQLPRASVDTGMGLERLTAAALGKDSNYDTEIFRPLLAKAAEIARRKYGDDAETDVSLRVIADHARAAAFLVSEGVFPDRAGREYVLRRVIRRAVRHGHRIGIREPFLHEIALEVVRTMSEAYSDLSVRKEMIAEVVRAEEERFRTTLEKGLALIAEFRGWESQGGKRLLPGPDVFKLYDTYGFPVDLLEVIGREQGFLVDHEGYQAAMAKARGKSSWKGSGEVGVGDAYRQALGEAHGAIAFTGYSEESGASEIVALIRDGEGVSSAAEGDAVEVVTLATPFYGEAGGQVGDAGVIEGPKGAVTVADTQKPLTGLVVHRGKVAHGSVARGDRVTLRVDSERRTSVRRNHSATHLLHFALRKVVGPQAQQKGSLVAPDRLRFDYSASKPLSPDEIARIEDIVNQKVLANADVVTEETTFDEARARGAIAIFEEKYGDRVRMVKITDDSVELCGGTHAHRSGDLGLFKIASEGGVAAGVRRIEALTGLGAVSHVRAIEGELRGTAGLLHGAPLEAAKKVEKLLAEKKELEKALEVAKRKLAASGVDDIVAAARPLGTVRVAAARVDAGDAGVIRDVADRVRDKLGSGAVLLAGEGGGKAILALAISKDLAGRVHAGKVVKDVAEVLGGTGGGRPDFAQGGAPSLEKLDEAFRTFYQRMEAALT